MAFTSWSNELQEEAPQSADDLNVIINLSSHVRKFNI